MNISPVSFGRTAVMSCIVRQDDAEKTATMYKMDTKDRQDYNDIMYSKHTTCIKPDFARDGGKSTPYREYYLLQDDRTKEVIACAETTKKYIQEGIQHPGTATVVEEMNVNYRFKDAVQPFFAFFAKEGKERKDTCILAAVHKDEIPDIQKAKLNQLNTGDWYLPSGRFKSLIEQSRRNSDVIFLA